MTQWPARLVLVGAGKMGERWRRAGSTPAYPILADDPRAQPVVRDRLARGGPRRRAQPPPCDPAPRDAGRRAKPQSLDQVAPQIAELAGERTLLLSIIAGKTIANLLARLPRAGAVVRAMPTRRPRSAAASPRLRQRRELVDARTSGWCERLLGAVGDFLWLDDEPDRRGDGDFGLRPAYVFALTEALAAAAPDWAPGGAVDEHSPAARSKAQPN